MIGQLERILELKSLFSGNKIESGSQKISFVSGKGGTGKSFLITNIAYSLSELGKKVLVVDLDLNFANLNLMVNVIAKKNIYDAYNSASSLDEIIYPFTNNLSFLFGISGFDDITISKADLARFVFKKCDSLTETFDYVFFDLGSGADEEVLTAAENSDKVIIVSTPEPTAVMDAYVMVKVFKQNGISTEKYCIINKCKNEMEAQKAYESISIAASHFLKEEIKYWGFIPESFLVSESIKNQKLLYITQYASEISGTIRELVNKITHIPHLANIHHLHH